MFQPQQYQIQSRKEIRLIIHFYNEIIPLIVYKGTSEQAIFENIRQLTNLYHFRCLNKKQEPLILSSNVPDKTHIYIENTNSIIQKQQNKLNDDNIKLQKEIQSLKNKIKYVSDAKNTIDILKSMLIYIEENSNKQKKDENNENNENKENEENNNNEGNNKNNETEENKENTTNDAEKKEEKTVEKQQKEEEDCRET
eukprot:350786_1